MKKKLLLVSLALVIVVSVIAAAVAPAAAVPFIGYQRPQPRNCGAYCWDTIPDDVNAGLEVNTCTNSWDFTDDVNFNLMTGGVRQYGNIVIVRWSGNVGMIPAFTSTPTATPTTTICSFYAIGVICGPAVVYEVCNNNGTLEKNTYNLPNWCGGQCGREQ
jgi:hypothetical protein